MARRDAKLIEEEIGRNMLEVIMLRSRLSYTKECYYMRKYVTTNELDYRLE